MVHEAVDDENSSTIALGANAEEKETESLQEVGDKGIS